jgi:hypothetical protein
MKPALLLKRGSTYSFPKMNLLGMSFDKLFDIFTYYYYYCDTVSVVREKPHINFVNRIRTDPAVTGVDEQSSSLVLFIKCDLKIVMKLY